MAVKAGLAAGVEAAWVQAVALELALEGLGERAVGTAAEAAVVSASVKVGAVVSELAMARAAVDLLRLQPGARPDPGRSGSSRWP